MQEFFWHRRGLMAAAATIFFGSTQYLQAVGQSDVIAPVQTLVNGLESVMKAGRGTPFQQRFAMLGPVIDRTFDLPGILRESVGPSWASLPADQQAMLVDAFRSYTVASYVNSFDNFDGQRFDIGADTRAVGNERVVQTKIVPKNGETHELDYVMRQLDGGWRVVDVLADGSISRVAVQRSDFRRLIARGGAPALADSLRTKSADLSDGGS